MMTFDLFHDAADDGSYELSINESAPLHFASRGAALGYAINIEGGDGRWRLFNGWRLCA